MPPTKRACPRETIERAAELYATTSPAVIRCGWGQERNRNGGNATLAILALPAVAGKFGVRGGGYAMSNSSAWGITRNWVPADEPRTRIVNMNQLGRALTEYDDPPVKMLFVYNSNAAVTSPDQRRVLRGLEREDLFTVVFDQVMTDTARYADVLLPATTFLEGYDLARGYGPISLRLGQPVIERVGEVEAKRRRLRRAAGAPGRDEGRRTLRRAGGNARCDRAPAEGDRRGPSRDRRRDAAVRRPADPVSRRLAADARRQGRPVSRRRSMPKRRRVCTAIRVIRRRPSFR